MVQLILSIVISIFITGCTSMVKPPNEASQPRSPTSETIPSVLCAKASTDVFTSYSFLANLCSGTKKTHSPADCAAAAIKLRVFAGDKELIAILCSGADDQTPIKCANESLANGLFSGSHKEIALFCSGANSENYLQKTECLKQANANRFASGSQLHLATLCSGKSVIIQ